MYDSLSKYYDLFADSDDESRAGISLRFARGRTGSGSRLRNGRRYARAEKRGFDVTGFDSSEGMLAAAYERASDSGETVDFVLKDVFRGGFGKTSISLSRVATW
ncbi:MAG: class I SAM-dependent methyltransferase [Christensenellales bacterium]